MSDRLWMHQFEIDLPAALRERHRYRAGGAYPQQEQDWGYLVHAVLAANFGQGRCKPFAIQGLDRSSARSGNFASDEDEIAARRHLRVLTYASAPAEELRDHAERYASPADFELLVAGAHRAKPMPAAWAEGSRLGFKVRVCPVVRSKRSYEGQGPDGTPRVRRSGSEVDAYLPAVQAAEGQPLRRDDVYREWLAAQLVGRGARVHKARVESFRLARLHRKDQGAERKSERPTRPDVVFSGELEVADGAAFAELLARGVGRHRAFGFGMLLLSAPA